MRILLQSHQYPLFFFVVVDDLHCVYFFFVSQSGWLGLFLCFNVKFCFFYRKSLFSSILWEYFFLFTRVIWYRWANCCSTFVVVVGFSRSIIIVHSRFCFDSIAVVYTTVWKYNDYLSGYRMLKLWQLFEINKSGGGEVGRSANRNDNNNEYSERHVMNSTQWQYGMVQFMKRFISWIAMVLNETEIMENRPNNQCNQANIGAVHKWNLLKENLENQSVNENKWTFLCFYAWARVQLRSDEYSVLRKKSQTKEVRIRNINSRPTWTNKKYWMLVIVYKFTVDFCTDQQNSTSMVVFFSIRSS